MYLCDYCNRVIELPTLLNTKDLYIIKMHNQLNWFCCEECRSKYLKEHCFDVKIDMAGHILMEES